MMPDRKWCHDVMRHARHGDASPEHSPRHENAKKANATRVNNTAHEETFERLPCVICKAHLPRPCSAPAPPQPSNGCRHDCLSTRRIKKQQIRQDHACLRGCKQPATFPCSTSEKNKQHSAVGATVLRDLQGSQSEPLPALLFLRSSHSDDRLPQLRERPVPLRLDEVALLALHLIANVALPMDL